jgi:hypothetical protein
MELYFIDGYYITIQRQGNNKNGNPLYIVNIFQKVYNSFTNINNHQSKYKLDKHNNIKLTSYNIMADVKAIINQIKTE